MIEQYKKSVDLDPKDADAWINLGDAHYDEKNFDEAIKAYKKSIELNPFFSEVWNNLGLTFSMIHQFEENWITMLMKPQIGQFRYEHFAVNPTKGYQALPNLPISSNILYILYVLKALWHLNATILRSETK